MTDSIVQTGNGLRSIVFAEIAGEKGAEMSKSGGEAEILLCWQVHSALKTLLRARKKGRRSSSPET